MKHLIICREYPPAPSGGIGTYAFHLSRLLAEAGECVHVIGQMWEKARAKVEEQCQGRLVIHRVACEDWAALLPRQPHPSLKGEARFLFNSNFPAQAFSWEAGLLAERLVEQEGIDIIESQDYEAPIYYLQLRRALGIGPGRQPPCFIHIHSPTEFIARHNDWDMSLPQIVTAKRLEDYTILAADALLCPSSYLSRQAEAHYGLPHDSIRVIPLPAGNNPKLERGNDIWEHGTICYSGRLERRKGVIEWIEAAAAVAADHPAVRFEFIGLNVLGNNTISSEKFLDRLVPRRFKSRFIFRGEQDRASIPKFLSRARIAVVPSRWENFPNTCVEAMCSGLPVIASREGGMAEMIEDGRTGWLASRAGSEGLEEALRRALNTPPDVLAEMGRQSSASIRSMCDNSKIVEKHLEFRSRLVEKGPQRSFSLASNLPWGGSKVSERAERRASQPVAFGGIAVIVACSGERRRLDASLSSLTLQTQKPATIIIVHDGDEKEQRSAVLRSPESRGWKIIYATGGMASIKNAGIEAALASGLDPLGFVFLREGERLRPDSLFEFERVLRHCPEVGLVSCWTGKAGAKYRASVKPCPAFPYQWVVNEAAQFSAVRTEALLEAERFRPVMEDGYESWDLFNAVMAAGWAAVTIPAVLGEGVSEATSLPRSPHDHVPGHMRRLLIERFADLIARDAPDVILLAASNSEHLPVGQAMLRHPRKMAMLVLARAGKKIRRAVSRLFGALIERF
jgi:glycosyltransferase involved in cell wall biosynthesis